MWTVQSARQMWRLAAAGAPTSLLWLQQLACQPLQLHPALPARRRRPQEHKVWAILMHQSSPSHTPIAKVQLPKEPQQQAKRHMALPV